MYSESTVIGSGIKRGHGEHYTLKTEWYLVDPSARTGGSLP